MNDFYRIISGGQTGVDQAALRAAKACGVRTGGWAPKGWLTEAGPAPWLADYGLKEHPREGYPARTAANVEAADGTLWVGNPFSRGGQLTLRCCSRAGVPFFTLSPLSKPADIAGWIAENGPVVNVAGNRESASPGIGGQTEAFLVEVFRLLKAERKDGAA